MSQYPVQFSAECPDRDLNRLRSFFRVFTVIPILIVVGAIVGFLVTDEYPPFRLADGAER